MSKKNANHILGSAILKDKRSKKKNLKSSLRHSTSLQEKNDYNRNGISSITEQSDIESFLSMAELAGQEYKAQRMNVDIIDHPHAHLSKNSQIEKLEQYSNLVRMPRRPLWDRSMSGEEFCDAERETFLQWRRSLSVLETENTTLFTTPYEKNIEFWRQLWRVVDRSDVVVQIVDARNPLLFYCEDLTNYVKEVDSSKKNLILVNKSDFLTQTQRQKWAKYFAEEGISALFFSALCEALPLIEESDEEFYCDEESASRLSESSSEEEFYDCQQDWDPKEENQVPHKYLQNDCDSDNLKVNSKMLSKNELTETFRKFIPRLKKCVTIGFVGYPNVGKSSVINCLMDQKKVSVSATPGKTKHFQSLFLSEDIVLCDCPGLVFPAFVSSKAEMIINGILPVDQMRDHVPPVNLVLSLIPRPVLESKYSLAIPLPREGENPNRCPNSEEFLNVYGYLRGYMTPRGIPDHPRSARDILKDFIKGKLLYCYAPPSISQESFHVHPLDKISLKGRSVVPQQRSFTINNNNTESIDSAFFNPPSLAHFKGKSASEYLSSSKGQSLPEGVTKPWRLKSKRNTRQKMRRKFAALDA